MNYDIKSIKTFIKTRLKKFFSLRFLKNWIEQPIIRLGVFQNKYLPESYGFSTLFTDDNTLFTDYLFRKPLKNKKYQVKVSLIATVFNEINNVPKWIEAITNQSRLPDEVIIVDAGSNDGTYEFLEKISQSSEIPFTIIREVKSNIAKGRNIAISRSNYSIIAATDFGCRPKKDWLQNLVTPFEVDNEIDLVAGFYVVHDLEGKPNIRRSWPTIDQVDPNYFIPSSRSIAFTKSIWSKVNGYPEWLTLTGEDTYFALELRKVCRKSAFVPDAEVVWFAPKDKKDYWKKIYYWSMGDGESGLHASNYWYTGKWLLGGFLFVLLGILFLSLLSIFKLISFINILIGFLFFVFIGLLYNMKKMNLNSKEFFIEFGASIARVLGFLKGYSQRKTVDLKRFEMAKGLFFILAGVPLDDTGGGSRGAQIARELLIQNYIVVYINKFPSYESIDLGNYFSHPNLISLKWEDFSWEKFTSEFCKLLQQLPVGCIIEFPLPEFLSLIVQMKQQNIVIYYDLLDAWDTQLGSTWYRKEVELKIIEESQNLIATAPILESYLSKLTKKPVHLLPNAVSHRLFNYKKNYYIPGDLPKAEKIILYIGALWGDWFDWRLLIGTAETFPDYAVVVIGDYRWQCPETLPNLHFLGLKRQNELPPYLKYSDVAIIPWFVNEISLATSPLKIYEYLAMHVPVVVPNLPLLADLPYVFVSTDYFDFFENIKQALKINRSTMKLVEFIDNNSWEHRVINIIRLLNNETVNNIDNH